MTIGISALCEGGRAIVIAADTRGSYSGKNAPPPHEQISKQIYLPFGFAASMAGHSDVCDDFLAYLHAKMELLREQKLKYVDDILKAVDWAQFQTFTGLVNHTMKMDLCITLPEWKGFEPTRRLYTDGLKIIQAEALPVSIIMAGFLDVRPVHLIMRRKCRPQAPKAYGLIGSGEEYARLVLDNRGQHEHFGFARTLVNIANALEAAAYNKDVGKPAHYVVCFPHGIVKRFPCMHEKFLKLVSDYANGDTAELDNDHTIGKELSRLLYADPQEPF